MRHLLAINPAVAQRLIQGFGVGDGFSPDSFLNMRSQMPSELAWFFSSQIRNAAGDLKVSDSKAIAYDCAISSSVFTVLQFLVVATTESFRSMALLESLVLP
jgi:hypothetical protein